MPRRGLFLDEEGPYDTALLDSLIIGFAEASGLIAEFMTGRACQDSGRTKMKIKIAVIVLGLLNVALFVSNLFLGATLRSEAQQRRSIQIQLNKNAGLLFAERARVANKNRLLADFREQLKLARTETARAETETTTESPIDTEPVEFNPAVEDGPVADLVFRPNPEAIPLLSAKELSRLHAKRSAMPTRLGVLATSSSGTVDVDRLLGDPVWNPRDRELSSDERVQLSVLLKDYAFFSRTSPFERFRAMRDEVPELREAGAFVEYRDSEGPPPLEGVRMSYAEPSEEPGVKRLYLFYEDDYPELAHQHRVEEQGAIGALVSMYELINGPLQYTSEVQDVDDP